MVVDRRQRVQEVFAAALAARESSARETIQTTELIGLCGGDVSVQREVQSLLDHLEAIGDTSSDGDAFLDPQELHGKSGPGAALRGVAILHDWGGDAIGQRIDGFTIIGKLGEGGMGIVYVAEQHNPRRTVALKLMRRGVATTATQRRFEREAQILGQLNHPGIAQIFAAGIADIRAGDQVVRTPYIAMERVDGPNIQQYVIERGRDVTLVLSMVIQVCEAVQHAHQRGIIHRDLKPANMLVARDAQQALVKVLDFGVARSISESVEHTAATQLTADGHLIGTLAYIAPEQLRSSDAVDTRADVYALGVVVYHLVTGRYPIDVVDCGIPEAARRIAEVEPAPLSTSGDRFDRDLETVVEKALKKDPARRYQSPGELARDLAHYLAGEPIAAKRDSLLYVMGKQARRYRAIMAAGFVVLVALAIVAGYARRQESKAQLARADADRTSLQLAAELSASRIEQGRLLGAQGNLLDAESMLWHEVMARPGSTHAHWALWELYSRFPCVLTIPAHNGTIRCVAWSPDGSLLASGGDDGTIRIFDARSGAPVRSIRSPVPNIWAVEFSPDGKRLFSAGEGGPETVFDVESGRELARPEGRTGPAYRVAWSSDGRLIASAGSDGTVRVWDAQSYEVRAVLKMTNDQGRATDCRAVCFDPKSQRLVAGSQSGFLRAWKISHSDANPVSLEPDDISFGPAVNSTIGSVSFSPDGTLIAAGYADRTTRLYNAVTGERIASLRTTNGNNRWVAFNPDGSQLAVAGYWRVDLWNVATRERFRPAGVESIVPDGSFCARYSPDGSTLATAASNGQIRLWQVNSNGGHRAIATHGGPVRNVVAARAGNSILVGSIGNDLGITVTSTDVTAAVPESSREWKNGLHVISPSMPRTLTFSPDASTLLVGCEDGMIREYNLTTGDVATNPSGHRGAVTSLLFNPDHTLLISGGFDGTVRVRRPADVPKASDAIAGNLGEIIGIDCSPDGRVLAVNGRAHRLQLFSVADGKPVSAFPPQAIAIWEPRFSPDGRWLAGGSWDRSILVWNVRALDPSPTSPRIGSPASLHGHSQLVGQVTFDDAGKLMASCSSDGTVQLWDVSAVPEHPGELPADSQRSLATLNAYGADAFTIRFLPAPLNDQLVVGYADGKVRVWDLKAFEPHIGAQQELHVARASVSP